METTAKSARRQSWENLGWTTIAVISLSFACLSNQRERADLWTDFGLDAATLMSSADHTVREWSCYRSLCKAVIVQRSSGQEQTFAYNLWTHARDRSKLNRETVTVMRAPNGALTTDAGMDWMRARIFKAVMDFLMTGIFGLGILFLLIVNRGDLSGAINRVAARNAN